ncbi:ABC transporter [Microbacterium rhizophilus]|uniref:ABC transporter n=1 Tax=Microbacterium rhizophilus TaxID=3138934 RepID=UPI0031E9FB10
MSDAKGPSSEPRDGEPIEGDTNLVPAPAEPGTAEGDTGDIPATRREARVTTGATDIVATPEDDAPVTRPSADEPVADEPADRPATAPAAEQPAAEEPDYAALAADLDDLENRGASTTVTTRAADAERKPDPWFEPADKTQTFTASDAYDAPAAPPAVTASEPVAPEPSAAPTAPPAQLPIFVQAPEPPRMRGNRGAAGAIGVLAALVFAVLYFAAKLGFGAVNGEVSLDNLADAALQTATSLGFWTTVVVFFLGFWLLGALVNRSRWAAWVLLGVFVGAIAYAGHILGALVDVPFWTLTASEGAEEVGRQLLSPLAIAAFVFAREITIWFGAWAARRGARVTERNADAQAEYERTLEAGPRLA